MLRPIPNWEGLKIGAGKICNSELIEIAQGLDGGGKR
jgi:hypothetical protein